ncbi:hypothetical protein Pst134EB_013963 [Puccinia striiformis f. sp. tritici]|uniref:Uncharacterized protein n=1 Tax=Puccinia striiformis f. sp. tritici PST-78 TaxID=1165861 RepID=A0A0L0UZA0_9BASI|nr:hypothetical protein Pst134EB_013963 [Puccinia striiformis f. sp. tritici]KNE92373.1 hypothetical protein PSTG_14208 [Puccinia striiformis f. sp. tritici PST-78]
MTIKPAELVLLSFYVSFLVVALSLTFLACWRIGTYSYSPELGENYACAFTESPRRRDHGNPNTDTYLSFVARNRARFLEDMAQEQLASAIERSLTVNAENFSDRTQSTLSTDPIPYEDPLKSSKISIHYSMWPASSPKKVSIQPYKEQIEHRSLSFAMSHLSSTGTGSSLQSSKTFAGSGMDLSSFRPRDWSEAHVKKT